MGLRHKYGALLFRFGAGAGLAAISTVIVTLQVLGLVFGTVGTEATGRRALPTQRSCMANSGGNLLVA